MKLTTNAKFAIRVAILAVGLVGTFIAGSVQAIPVADGGPILVCTPQSVKNGTCQVNLPPMLS